MKELIEKLKEFNSTFNVPFSETQIIPHRDDAMLRFKLINEENIEYKDAVQKETDEEKKTEALDALVDIQYILIGTIIQWGFQDVFMDAFNEVHRSNMSKLDENGKPIIREDGKILKGPNYFPPNLGQFVK
jgi:predicted HAD superfamily Cof-like phosphohydrolase